MSLWTRPLQVPDRFYAAHGNPKIATAVHAAIVITTILLSMYAFPLFPELFGGGSHFPKSFVLACNCSNVLREYFYLVPFVLVLLIKQDHQLMTRLQDKAGPVVAGKVAIAVALGLLWMFVYSWWGVVSIMWRIPEVRTWLGISEEWDFIW